MFYENNEVQENLKEIKSQANLNHENSNVYQKFPTPEEIANRSLAYLNKNNKEFEFQDNNSHSNFSSLMSPFRNTGNEQKKFMGNTQKDTSN